jgi:hypothetical protein
MVLSILADGRKLTLYVILQKKICMVELFSNVTRKGMIEGLLVECIEKSGIEDRMLG